MPEATTPTSSDVRAPYIVRTKRSRPVPSAPNQKSLVRPLRNAELVLHRVGVGRRVRVAGDRGGDRAADDRDQDQQARSRPPPKSATLSSRKRAQKSCDATPARDLRLVAGAKQLGRRRQVGCGRHPTVPRNVRVGPDTGRKYRTYFRPRRLARAAERYCVSASAPATTSRISWVISAWRARFIASVSVSISSPADFEAFRIAVIRAPCSEAADSSSAR